jgi:hypothetical protein
MAERSSNEAEQDAVECLTKYRTPVEDQSIESEEVRYSVVAYELITVKVGIVRHIYRFATSIPSTHPKFSHIRWKTPFPTPCLKVQVQALSTPQLSRNLEQTPNREAPKPRS